MRTVGPVVVLLSLLLVLTACANAGRRVDRMHLDDIQNGTQTRDQIEAWFGEPYSVRTGLQQHPSGCVERWTCEYAEAQGFGTVTYQEMLIVDFDAAGKVCDHAFSRSGED